MFDTLGALNYFNDPRVQAGRDDPWYIEVDAERLLVVIETRTADAEWLEENGYDPEEYSAGDTKPLEYSEMVDDGPCQSCNGVGKQWKGYGPGVVDSTGTLQATMIHHEYQCCFCYGNGRRTKLVTLPEPRLHADAEDRPYRPYRYLALPCRMVDCPTCHGKGTHVNPSVDSGGITDFGDWSPDDQDFYMGGGYDVVCYGCKGSRQAPEVDVEALCQEDAAAYQRFQEWQDQEAQDRYDDEAERAAEIRAGC